MILRRSRSADVARLNTELLGYFGVSVVLPDGSDVRGVFAHMKTPANPWPETGAALDITKARNPEISLSTTDASGLTKNTPLLIDGERYLVVDLDPPSDGMTRVTLMHAPIAAPRPPTGSRWQ
ncbi:hypothetical protein [Thiocapsa sp.]|uniref:head-tail joining protein n=1 Tax=Thiocapsa sp. TaxID=2024551 RepID=UPI0025E85B51|nr:hypothetical protein [Thiocapsa sp.]